MSRYSCYVALRMVTDDILSVLSRLAGYKRIMLRRPFPSQSVNKRKNSMPISRSPAGEKVRDRAFLTRNPSDAHEIVCPGLGKTRNDISARRTNENWQLTPFACPHGGGGLLIFHAKLLLHAIIYPYPSRRSTPPVVRRHPSRGIATARAKVYGRAGNRVIYLGHSKFDQ